MPTIPSCVLDEIHRHDLASFKILPLDHEAVTLAVAFLFHRGMMDMGRCLRQLAQENRLRVGPLQGLVACGLSLPRQGQWVLLSNLYPSYMTPTETMMSLVYEIGALEIFDCAPDDNEIRAHQAKEWVTARQAQKPESLIFVAARKKSENN